MLAEHLINTLGLLNTMDDTMMNRFRKDGMLLRIMQ